MSCFPQSEQHWALMFSVMFVNSFAPMRKCLYGDGLGVLHSFNTLSGSSALEYVADKIRFFQP